MCGIFGLLNNNDIQIDDDLINDDLIIEDDRDASTYILNTILNENNIKVLFGDDENYFETFDTWFNNSL